MHLDTYIQDKDQFRLTKQEYEEVKKKVKSQFEKPLSYIRENIGNDLNLTEKDKEALLLKYKLYYNAIALERKKAIDNKRKLIYSKTRAEITIASSTNEFFSNKYNGMTY